MAFALYLGGMGLALLGLRHLLFVQAMSNPVPRRQMWLLALLWPVSLLLCWVNRQHTIWQKATPHPLLWMHDTERPSEYHLISGLSIRCQWRHRRVYPLGNWVVLFRPRPTLEAPLLLGKGRLILTPLLCQLHLCWGKTSNVRLKDLL